MPKITNFSEARVVLSKFVPRIWSSNQPYTLERMHQLMTLLDNPQEKLKAIHIAGTSGKTSTCYYIAALLKQAGRKTGLTISPHVDEVNERVQINLEPMPEYEFCKELSKFINIVKSSQIKPTYFELLVAFSYWEFVRQQVDYAVVEVGLGGLLDGTNVFERADKVCVITDIGLDHTNVLGKDLASIAAQKVGIIKDHNVVFCYEQDQEVMSAIRQACSQHHAQLCTVHPPTADDTTQALPAFQRRNYELAHEVVDYVVSRDELSKLSIDQLRTAAATLIPARMEIIKRSGKTIILDGAHNPQKLQALMTGVRELFPGKKIAVLMGIVSGKDTVLKDVVAEVQEAASHIIFTGFSAEQDMPRPSFDPKDLMSAANSIGFKNADVIENPEDAFEVLNQRPEPILLVTGSFYLLNHVRPLIFSSDD